MKIKYRQYSRKAHYLIRRKDRAEWLEDRKRQIVLLELGSLGSATEERARLNGGAFEKGGQSKLESLNVLIDGHKLIRYR